jgi:hypothetical protein
VSQYDLLSPERQLTLDGRAEPLLSPSPAAEIAPLSDAEAAQAELFGPKLPQLPLPLPSIHAPNGDHAHADCLRGFSIGQCVLHDELPTLKQETCGRQRCDSSWKSNTLERARDAHNGTADDEAERLALRHFGGRLPLGVFVFTLPAHVAARAVGDQLKRWRRAMGDVAVEILRAQCGHNDALFYGRSWLHPVGEAEVPATSDDVSQARSSLRKKDGQHYHPHENVLIPLACLVPGARTYVRRLNPKLPREWLGSDGWVSKRLCAIVRDVFGVRVDVINWFYEFRVKPEHKAHALKYFARVFPEWAAHPDVPLRPRAFGLAHWKQKEHLREVLAGAECVPLPEWGACPECAKNGECGLHNVVGASESEDSARYSFNAQAVLHVAGCEACAGREANRAYVQHRRIITRADGSTGPPERGKTTDPPAGHPSSPTPEQKAALRVVPPSRSAVPFSADALISSVWVPADSQAHRDRLPLLYPRVLDHSVPGRAESWAVIADEATPV